MPNRARRNLAKVDQQQAFGIMTNQYTKNSRVLQELLETTAELSTYDLVSKTDMAFMRVLCEEPPAYTPERIGSIRDGNCEAEPSCIRSPLKREHLERSKVGVPCSEQTPWWCVRQVASVGGN
jgi:hypothetical protein